MDFNESRGGDSRVTNKAGGEAFEIEDPRLALYKKVINNLLENTYYEEDTESLEEVVRRVDACAEEDPEFALQLASYARQEMGLRDISQVLLVMAANDERVVEAVDKGRFADYGVEIMDRADEPATAIAIQMTLFGKPIPRRLRAAIEAALNTYDSYEFSKYMQRSREVSMYDVLNLVRPEAYDDEHDELFGRVARGDLDAHDEEPLTQKRTWEAVISEKGNTPEAWRSVLDDMGLFARIRNVRNMLQAGLSGEEIFEDVDTEWLESSSVLPFRFYQAHCAIEKAGLSDRYAETFLDAAVERTADNLPDTLEDTLVAVDISGSMGRPLSAKSEMTPREIACLFGTLLQRKGAHCVAFAGDAESVETVDGSIFDQMEAIREKPVGGQTFGWKVFAGMCSDDEAVEAAVGAAAGTNTWREYSADDVSLRVDGTQFDRVVFLTDMQLWGGSANAALEHYRQQYDDDLAFYNIDLQAYGEVFTPEDMENTYHIGGWSERVVNFIEYAENEMEEIERVAEWDPEPRVYRAAN